MSANIRTRLPVATRPAGPELSERDHQSALGRLSAYDPQPRPETGAGRRLHPAPAPPPALASA